MSPSHDEHQQPHHSSLHESLLEASIIQKATKAFAFGTVVGAVATSSLAWWIKAPSSVYRKALVPRSLAFGTHAICFEI
jgi:hypothetical protein